MISLKELLGQAEFKDQSKEVQDNLMILLERINKIRTAYAKSMTVTSGLRTKADHQRIYDDINKKKKAQGLPEVKIPWRSQHLKGAAVDIADADGKLKEWVNKNVKLLETVGLWCESFEATPTWVHFQIHSPASGARFFKP